MELKNNNKNTDIHFLITFMDSWAPKTDFFAENSTLITILFLYSIGEKVILHFQAPAGVPAVTAREVLKWSHSSAEQLLVHNLNVYLQY